MPFYCYILECADGSYYTGWTMDISRRLEQHNQGRGARYTRMHRPARLVYWEQVASRSEALKKEVQLKQFTHTRKTNLIKTHTPPALQKLPHAQWLAQAPGRINLLGEHIDYNGGPVMPAAINRRLTAAGQISLTQHIVLHALDLNETCFLSLESIQRKQDIYGVRLPAWALYPAGVAAIASRMGKVIKPLEIAFHSSIPMGAGLSSSAALEVAFALLWMAAGQWKMDKMDIAQLCHQAEVEYVGLNCGLMDPIACLYGKDHCSLLVDTAQLTVETNLLPADIALIVINSSIRHNLRESGYNQRHQECRQALSLLQKQLTPAPAVLSDILPSQLSALQHMVPPLLFKRVQHVAEETQRVKDGWQALQAGNFQDFGRLLNKSHASLRDNFEVSLPEIDCLVSAAQTHPGCLGARLMGGGFGGSTLNLVRQDSVKEFISHIGNTCHCPTGRTAEIFVCQATDGAAVFKIR